jgi:hypothetical protein
MTFQYKESRECAKSELDLFEIPDTQAMIISGKDIYYYPISSLDGDTPIEFNVTGSDEYIDLNSIFLYLEVNITKADGSAFANTVVYAPVNKFKDALFSQAKFI